MKTRLKNLIKGLVPPLIFEAIRMKLKRSNPFIISPYSSWDETRSHCTGYDSDLIINKVRDAALQVKAGEASFERDSVLFYENQYPFPLLAGLLRLALVNAGNLSVLDFGGSLGSTYYQTKPFFSGIKRLRWNIVEQKKFVDIGKEMFEDNMLAFYYSIDECLKFEKPDVILLSSVLQYVKEPFDLLEVIIAHNFKNLIIDRTPFLSSGGDLLTIQRVPKSIYEASYPAWILDEKKLLTVLQKDYFMVTEFPGADGIVKIGKILAPFKGLIFTRKDG